jgi:hypothetical protein
MLLQSRTPAAMYLISWLLLRLGLMCYRLQRPRHIRRLPQ